MKCTAEFHIQTSYTPLSGPKPLLPTHTNNELFEASSSISAQPSFRTSFFAVPWPLIFLWTLLCSWLRGIFPVTNQQPTRSSVIATSPSLTPTSLQQVPTPLNIPQQLQTTRHKHQRTNSQNIRPQQTPIPNGNSRPLRINRLAPTEDLYLSDQSDIWELTIQPQSGVQRVTISNMAYLGRLHIQHPPSKMKLVIQNCYQLCSLTISGNPATQIDLICIHDSPNLLQVEIEVLCNQMVISGVPPLPLGLERLQRTARSFEDLC